jgi:hypothetical protein
MTLVQQPRPLPSTPTTLPSTPIPFLAPQSPFLAPPSPFLAHPSSSKHSHLLTYNVRYSLILKMGAICSSETSALLELHGVTNKRTVIYRFCVCVCVCVRARACVRVRARVRVRVRV